MKKFFTLITAIIVSTAMAFASDTYIITGYYNSWSLTDNYITFTEQTDGSFTATADEFTTGTNGFKIVKNPATEGWNSAYGFNDLISVSTGDIYSLSRTGGNIHLGKTDYEVTLHNVKFEFTPSNDGTLGNFKITADEKIIAGEAKDKYLMAGTWQGWSLTSSPLEFEDKGNGVYTASIDAIYGAWKIVKNNSWAFTLSNANLEMVPGNTYDLQRGSTNSGFATGKLLKDAKFTLTIKDDGSATLKVEGTLVEHTYSIVGKFNSWSLTDGPFLKHQEDGSWTADINNFPGGEEFKVSIDKSWTCFLAQSAPASLTFGEAYTCARADNANNFTIGEKGTNYDIHVVLVVADDVQSASLTITSTPTGINLIDADDANNAKTTIYNISGQRLTELQNGINIVNGKKFIRK